MLDRGKRRVHLKIPYAAAGLLDSLNREAAVLSTAYTDEGIEAEVERKIDRLPLRKGVSARAVLVYDGELDPVVEGNGFFDAIIPASRLLGL